ncbi:hypothetical protein BDQ12DRAFT_418940 [Crucibulum laeve]|uniref:Uncharacterized protein n=1 Tax=Crucibulum laeve TaxID=68775 RepID=A0A5C3M8K8_9AGAR|nr:hypothetical protein BDQ12DRAFT_418940 [Crucibulum laeve]
MMLSTLIYYADSNRLICVNTGIAFMTSIRHLISQNPCKDVSTSVLLQPLLVALTTLQTTTVDITENFEVVWELASSVNKHTLTIASCFAYYVFSANSLPMNCLQQLELCAYFSDVLLINTAHGVLEDETLYSLMYQVICGALVKFFDSIPNCALYMLQSPWKLSLLAALECSTLSGDVGGSKSIVKILLDRIKNTVSIKSPQTTKEAMNTQLLFIREDAYPQLIVLPTRY